MALLALVAASAAVGSPAEIESQVLQMTRPPMNTKQFAVRLREQLSHGRSDTGTPVALVAEEAGGTIAPRQTGSQSAAETIIAPAAPNDAVRLLSQLSQSRMDEAVARSEIARTRMSIGAALHTAAAEGLEKRRFAALDAAAKKLPADLGAEFPAALVKRPETAAPSIERAGDEGAQLHADVSRWNELELQRVARKAASDRELHERLRSQQTFTLAMDEDATPTDAAEAMSCSLLSLAERDTNDHLVEEARQMQQKAAAAVARRWERLKKDVKLKCKADGSRSKVAALIAADIRLPPVVVPQEWASAVAHRHRGGFHDACNRTRGEVLDALNRFTKGSDLFIHTDSAYADEVSFFESAVAVRYTSEDGGNAATENMGNRGGAYVQWWRMQKAWQLLVDYEKMCSHTYSFVMKIRTDMNLIGERTLLELYEGPIMLGKHEGHMGYDLTKTAFMSSDRFFAGSRSTMEHMAKFGEAWDKYTSDGVMGLCGSCDYLNSVYRAALVTPACYEVANEVPTTCNRGCFTDAKTESSICTVYQSEGFQIKGTPERKVQLGTEPSEGTLFRQNATNGLTCTYGTGSSEKTFVHHILSAGLTVVGFEALDAELWSHQHADLMVWRHLVHVYADGFAVEDGPLHPTEEYGSELKWVQIEMLARQTGGSGSMIACFNKSQTRHERPGNFYTAQEDFRTAAFTQRANARRAAQRARRPAT